MATDFIRPPELLEMHTKMVQKLGELFSVKSKKWNNILRQVEMLNLLPKSDVGEIETMFDLFICLVQKKGNGITYGEYASIRTILGYHNNLAEEIIDDYTGRIHAFYKDVPTVEINTESYSVKKGQTVVLKCELIKSNTAIVDVQWKRKAKGKDTFTDIDIDGERYVGGSVQSPSLCITETREEDNEATYICQVKNAAGTGQSDEIRVKITQPEQETDAALAAQRTRLEKCNNALKEVADITNVYVRPVGEMKAFIMSLNEDTTRQITVEVTAQNDIRGYEECLQKQLQYALGFTEREFNLQIVTGKRKISSNSDSETENEGRESPQRTGNLETFLALQPETSQRDSQESLSPFNNMAAKDKSLPEILKLHKEMVEKLRFLFAFNEKAFSDMCSQVEILRLLSYADLGEVKSLNDLFIKLIKSNNNSITHGNYYEIYGIFNDQDVEAGNIIQRFTKRIAEASKTKGKRKQRRYSNSESETEESISKGRKGKRKHSLDSDSETEVEDRKSKQRKGYHKHSRDSDSDSGREADGGESNQRKENAGNLRKEFDDIQNARIVYTWQTAMNAVGFIQGPVAHGTGFRVGKDKIMTAYKVVEAITKIHKGAKPDLSNLGQNNVFITFNFIEANDSKNTRKFYITECLFHDREMDFAILQLRNKDKTEDSSYPKAITHFKPVHPDQTFALLSHPDGKPMQLEPKVHIFDTKSDQGKRRLEEMKQWGRKQGKKSAYENILDKNKVLFDCWTRYGGSGSPGIEMGSDGEPVCSLMLLRGFPDFVYSEGKHSKKEYHPYMVEQGVTMEAIAAALNRMGSEEKALKREIFGDNAFLY